jgi:hypothetical protein
MSLYNILLSLSSNMLISKCTHTKHVSKAKETYAGLAPSQAICTIVFHRHKGQVCEWSYRTSGLISQPLSRILFRKWSAVGFVGTAHLLMLPRDTSSTFPGDGALPPNLIRKRSAVVLGRSARRLMPLQDVCTTLSFAQRHSPDNNSSNNYTSPV